MALLALSASHRDLHLGLLEHLSSGTRSVGSAAVADASVAGCVVLTTCNRFELYLEAAEGIDPEVAVKVTVQAVADGTGLSPGDVGRALRLRVGAYPVAEHLFAVASGLDSMVVGEREVAGQVRRALVDARADGTTSSVLERLFQSASRASRAVGAGTGLGSSGRSVAAVALDLAAGALPAAAAASPGPVDGDADPLAGTRVLVIGTGAFGRATVKALRRRGVSRVAVHSPSGRAVAPTDPPWLTVVPPDGLAGELARADLVVGCSGVRGPVLGPDDVRAARPSGGPMVLVDLALRHDIDPAVARLPGVTLIDLATVQARAGLVAPTISAGQQVVAEHARRFADRIAELDVVPAVVALRRHVQGLVDDELRRGDVRSPEAERALRRFAARLLHESLVQARRHARHGDAHAYRVAVEMLLGPDVPDSEQRSTS